MSQIRTVDTAGRLVQFGADPALQGWFLTVYKRGKIVIARSTRYPLGKDHRPLSNTELVEWLKQNLPPDEIARLETPIALIAQGLNPGDMTTPDPPAVLWLLREMDEMGEQELTQAIAEESARRPASK